MWKNERVLQFDLAPIASLPCQSRGVAGAALRKKCLSAHLIFDEHKMTMNTHRRSCTGGRRRQTQHISSLLWLAVVWTSLCSVSVLAFAARNFCPGRRANVLRLKQQQGREPRPTLLLLTSKNEDERSDDKKNNNSAEDDKMLSELVRAKLEADHTRKFLRSRPRKLAYDEARTWVQRNLGVDTEDEFNDLVENGNLRTPYIPKRPEEYYRQSTEWISWDHFLKDDRNYPGVKPASGAFD